MINKIHLGDCLELFPKLEDNSVDLIVAGPPYNIDIKYDSPFNDCVEWSEYLEWMESWLSECYRVLKDDGRICVNHQITIVDKYTNESRFPIMDIRNIQDKIGFNVHKLIIWEDGTGWKWKGSPEKRWGGGTWKSAQKPYISNVYESILISCKKDWKRLENGKTTITEKDFVDATKQIWNIETSGGHEQRGAFGSIELPKRCIELLSYENDLVLDPFMGSGSTAIACKETNRRYIGFEISESSVELSNDKLKTNWKAPLPKRTTNDHVIITSGRTGSNLLCAILNMHPQCVNRGEIFGEIRNLFLDKIFWERPDYMIENFWFRDYHNLESKGFKYLYFQDLKRNSNISDFVKNGDFKIIHLKRRNKLKQYVSWKKVKEGDAWGDNFLISNGDNPWLNSKIEIDVDDLLNRFKIEGEQEKIYDEKFPNALEVYYEDMISDFSLEFTEDNNKTIQKCFEHLNLDYQRMIDGKQDVNSFLKETDFLALESHDLENYTGKIEDGWFDIGDNKDFVLQKTRILPIDKCISNYDEVKKKLYGTEYDKYLEETSSLYSELEMKDKLYNLLTDNNIDIDVLKKNKVFLKGGAILRLFMDLSLDTDLDFYFTDSDRLKRVDDYFLQKHHFLNESPAYKKYKCGELEVEIVRHENLIGTYEELYKKCDFTIATACFDFETECFRYSQDFIDDLKNKVLRLNTVIEEERAIITIYRGEKYEKLGFYFPKDMYDKLKLDSELGKTNELYMRFNKKSWLRNEELSPIIPNIDIFVNWLMDIKKHKYFNKFNYYLTGGFIAWPNRTKDIDIIITKRNGQRATLRELEELMVDMFDSAYDTHGFFLDTFYMRTPQWIADYPRDREVLKSVERKQLFITITKYEDKGIVCKYRRYGLLNCTYTGSFTLRGTEPSVLVHRWVDLEGNYAKWVDLRRIIKYYNNKERNIEDFLNEFQEYSGY
jgi:site-specific DNA-methyltransferase (adenine-specific)